MICPLLNAPRFGTVASWSPSSASREHVLQKVGVLKVKLQVMFCSGTFRKTSLQILGAAQRLTGILDCHRQTSCWHSGCGDICKNKALLLLSQQALEICNYEDQDQVQAC